MKVLVLLSLVALSVASSISSGKRVIVTESGIIRIVGNLGREIDIFQSVMDPSKVNIILSSPFGPSRKLQVDEVNNIRNVGVGLFNIPSQQISQADILVNIFRQYQGDVNEASYIQLLGKIEALVQSRVLNQIVLEVLKNLDLIEELKGFNFEQIRGFNALSQANGLSNVIQSNNLNNIEQLNSMAQLEQIIR